MSEKVTAWRHTCKRCGHIWISPREHPTVCAKCKTAYWNLPRKLKKKENPK